MKSILCSIFIIISILLVSAKSEATVFFSWDSENQACGMIFPFYSEAPDGNKGRVVCGTTPQGSKYLEWPVQALQNQAYTEIAGSQGLPVTASLGTTYYLAGYFQFTRINGIDIWRPILAPDTNADKSYEFVGNGVRWVILFGQLESACMDRNQPGKFSVWVANASYHLSRPLECVDQLVPNASGYSTTNPPQIDYDTWHTMVMAVKLAADNTGSITFYVNGKKTLEHLNIPTAANNSPTIDSIKLNGTFSQPDYNTPERTVKYDALLLTDNWQDILNGGYMTAGQPPPPPPGRQITIEWNPNLESDLAGYRIYCGTATRTYGAPVDVQLTNTPQAPSHTFTVPADGTYFFAVTAYDTTGNESGFSNEVSRLFDLAAPSPPNNIRLR